MIEYTGIRSSDVGTPTEPVTLSDVKAWANIDHSDDDTLLSSLIIGARQDIEKETNLALVAKSIVVDVVTTCSNKVKLPYGIPSSVVVVDNEESVTLTADDDYTHLGSNVKVNDEGDYNITYTLAPTVPTGIKEAIKMLVTYRYNHRGDQEEQMGLPEDIKHKVSKYREEWL